ncbi:GntR family transcriptional regulator [Neptunomonas antarctica]|uniref:Transcriptional regulator, GntR family n=1 Tax=Neptunomonas antarctica TaxID=619304 RepID=A0A1N7N6K9_9GAMM|nr:GntR family transcriptional regulator [Neptunomonas antarctica]SIS94043.1 transcriptional regulator, GntR family [Neptunomonas antarctica]
MSHGRHAELRKELENQIFTGKLKPGDRLDETKLSEIFGVSRTPVREALLQLKAAGLIEMRARKGAVVASIELKDLLEMFEVMAELEGMCARLAARRASVEDIEDIRNAHNACQTAAENKDYDQYYALNVDFHEAIYKAARNRYLASETIALRNRLSPYRRTQLRNSNRVMESFTEHSQIFKAIEDRDVNMAEKLLKDHVNVQGASFSDFVASLP